MGGRGLALAAAWWPHVGLPERRHEAPRRAWPEVGATLTPARRYGPAGVHRPPAQPEPIAYAELCTPADCYAAALGLLNAGFTDEAHTVLASGADSAFPACRAAAQELERDPPAAAAAIKIIAAALAAAEDDHATD